MTDRPALMPGKSLRSGRKVHKMRAVFTPAPLRPEEIYDAATDAALFAGLAGRLADSVGARSGVLHWRDTQADQEEVSYSGYFSADQMAVYAEHFEADDLWSAAISAPEPGHCVRNCAELVPPRQYESGRLYNEWIRAMGDDSFHGLGGALRIGDVVAEFGFHRGRSQQAFGEAEVRALAAQVEHLRRLVVIRHRLWAAERQQAALAGAQDALGYGVITLSAAGRLLQQNRAAEAILRREDGLAVRSGRLIATAPAGRAQLAAMLDETRATGSARALHIPRAGGGRYELSMLSIWSDGERRIVLVAHDPDGADRSLPARLRSRYGLSAAEVEVAIALADARSPAEVAERRGTSLETVRNQIKTISAKLGCGRQSEIVALVRDMPRLDARLDA